ncbi:MAG: cellulose synthase family protein [Flavobacteriales bacterium]
MALALLIINGLALTFILIYSFVQLDLVALYCRWIKRKAVPSGSSQPYPFVTVQLPIFNEYYVAERLIDAVMAIRYPEDRFQVQVLDDSNDETVDLIAEKVSEWQEKGGRIEHVRRSNRTGFKAGALAYGLQSAQGTLIAVFDADFLPAPDFLERTVPVFQNEEVGLVQTKWEHINEDHSMLTRLQAFGLDAHFSVEQGGRNQGGHFINFNGTAGVWRRTCIEDAGGWQSDTLTEDLDLSYRAQIRGWTFRFLEDVGSPAELPAAMTALKTQQYRWNKGAAECTRKNLPKVLKDRKVPLNTKIHAVFHLMNSSIFVCVLLAALLSIPALFIKHYRPEYGIAFKIGSVYVLALLFLILFYWTSFSRTMKGMKGFLLFLIRFPMFLAVSMGMSLHNGIAVLEGYSGVKSRFLRTPKFNIKGKADDWKGKRYMVGRVSPLTFLEGFLAVYFAWGIYLAYYFGDAGLLPFHLLLTIGFGFVTYYSVRHAE